MCRLLMANYEGVMKLQETLNTIPGCSTLEKYLEDLELRDGGHGNGYATFKDGKLKEFKKGVDLPVSEIAQAMESEEYDWFLFHTREASAGSISDANCHPYHVQGNREIIAAANGNERSVSPLAHLNNITDSEFILRIISQMDMPLFETLQVFESNFFGFYDGKPFVKKGNRDMLIWKKEDGIVFASDFPFGMEGLFRPDEDYFWFDGIERKQI